jgi:hypothetical protein
MKPWHPFVSGPGRRTPATMLALDERNRFLAEAAQKFFPGLSDYEIAWRLRHALSTYRNGRWWRDRAENTCPPQHKGKLAEVLWMILKTKDAVPGERTIRAALAQSSA